MSSKSFSLEPFLSGPLPADIRITGVIHRTTKGLSIVYEILGDLSAIEISATAETPVRKHALWRETCFELFLGAKSACPYWEFNLSPTGHWNIYHFTAYRQGMKEEPAFRSLPLVARRQRAALLLSVDIDIDRIIPSRHVVEAGISAVMKTIDGTVTYWALTHPGPQADFHRRDSFIIDV